MVPDEIVDLLNRHRFRGRDEEDYQDVIESVLVQSQVPYLREEDLSATDRIDFLLGSTGVEVKTKGSPSAITRQLSRYARSERINHLVLVSSRVRLLQVPEVIHGVPVTTLALRGGML